MDPLQQLVKQEIVSTEMDNKDIKIEEHQIETESMQYKDSNKHEEEIKMEFEIEKESIELNMLYGKTCTSYT